MTFSKELSAGGGMSEILVQNKHLSFKSLPEHLSSTMQLYDITPEMWDLARKNTTHIPKAGEFIGSDVFTYINDDEIRSYLSKTGIDAKNYNSTSLGRVRDDISHKWSTYIRDQISHGVMTPDAASRAFWLFGHTAPKTAGGQALQATLRCLSAFRSYETALLTKPLARFALGKGAVSYFDAILRGQGNWRGFIKFAATAYVLSMVKNAIDAEVTGKQFKTPFDFFAQSLETSGFIGLFTRLAPSSHSTPARIFEDIVGPAISEVVEGTYTAEQLVTGNLSKRAAYHYVTKNIPVLNDIYFRKALNYLFLREVETSITGVDPERLKKDLWLGG
jgi:hypothetical protein